MNINHLQIRKLRHFRNAFWVVRDTTPFLEHFRLAFFQAIKRILDSSGEESQGVGSISYVVAYTENSFVELTQQYLSTDTIIIRVARNGEPLADAEVVLEHRFGKLTTQLPCDGRTFHTDVNGTVTLHLGKPYYINDLIGSEEYYWDCHDNDNTHFVVFSRQEREKGFR